ncbi:charged multivesicular body protein 4 [Dioscorea alata]|uniref:Charged multivesicular body protein 4 n=1 Tax=Dioscorea alata TaxID=55571 RepID=A0ACB7UGF1_DIOAL|nr:charged multivesicular body protein 4 [Dioscorea alata]
MFAKLFRRCRKEPSSGSSSLKLKQTLAMLKEKEIVLQKKISIEAERAREFTKAKNKQAALESLKRKRYYEVQMEQLESFQSRILDQQEQKLPQKSPVHCREVQQMSQKVKIDLQKSNLA